jgi:hypothetical protein
VTPLASGLATLLVGAGVLALAGCDSSRDEAAPEPAEPQPAAPAAEPESFDPVGTWTVVGHHMPGISAIGDDEAKSRHGQTVQLTKSEAISTNDRCDAPAYSVRSVAAEEYLAIEFHIEAGKLAPLAGREELRLVEVSCDGAPWVGFGALLIEVSEDRVLTPWDGVFFELERAQGSAASA